MEEQEIKEIDLKHVSIAAAGLIKRIESILPTIPNDRVKMLVAMKLSTAISKGGDEAMLRQILLLAVTAVESSELIEHKMNTNDLEYNIVTGEILSEIDCIPTLDKIIEFKEKVLKSLSSKKSNLKPPSSAV
ncbi:hypothetical protein HP546_02520 [Pseudomonas sp. CM25]|uniref:hypothetical protein n=1 Tax=Pseudomonas sp. CM25 TaxID=2738448 RepID=UPI00155652D7|nr:hypothetical protein [Pseudomonas sp. CM25]NQD54238.1 hypothetical protein [Pseudomonas sp. CM25]